MEIRYPKISVHVRGIGIKGTRYKYRYRYEVQVQVRVRGTGTSTGTKYVRGTGTQSKVIKAGLTSEGVSDINDHPSGKSYNESFILRVRRQFRQRIYDDDIPQHLKDWLDHWHTPLTDVQAVSTSTHLPRSYQTVGATTSQQIDLTEDTTHTDRSGPSHLWGDINPPPSGGPPHHLPFKGGALAHTEPPSEEGEGPAPGPTGAP